MATDANRQQKSFGAQVERAGKKLTVWVADAFALNNGEEKLVATMLATMIVAEKR